MPIEQRFLDASEALQVRIVQQEEAERRREHERREQIIRLQMEKQQRTRMLRLGIAISSSLAVLACVLGGLAVRQSRLANQRLAEAETVALQIVTVGDERPITVAGASEARRDLLALSSELLKTLNAPGRVGSDRAQSWNLSKQADLILTNPLQSEHGLREAAQLYEQARTITEAQLKQNPESTVLQRDLAKTYDSLGMVLEQEGKLAESMRWHERSLAIRTKLADANPSNVVWQRDPGSSHRRTG